MKKNKIIIGLALLTMTINAETLKDIISKESSSKDITTKEINVSKIIHEINSTTVKNPHKIQNSNPYYEGEVVTVEQAGAYTYLEVKEKTEKTFWAAVNSADVKVGDYVRFQMELVTKNFKSKILNKTFKEVMFASGLQYRVLKK